MNLGVAGLTGSPGAGYPVMPPTPIFPAAQPVGSARLADFPTTISSEQMGGLYRPETEFVPEVDLLSPWDAGIHSMANSPPFPFAGTSPGMQCLAPPDVQFPSLDPQPPSLLCPQYDARPYNVENAPPGAG